MTIHKLIYLLIFFNWLPIFSQKGEGEIRETSIAKRVGEIVVTVTQNQASGKTPGIPYCSAKIVISQNSLLRDSIVYPSIEPVGGHYGLLIYDKLVNGHLIISKYGDYDNRTIIINEKGRKFNITGGFCFVDDKNGFLFSTFSSDLPTFSVFDFNTDKEILVMTIWETHAA